jgi:hypothetical protein
MISMIVTVWSVIAGFLVLAGTIAFYIGMNRIVRKNDELLDSRATPEEALGSVRSALPLAALGLLGAGVGSVLTIILTM